MIPRGGNDLTRLSRLNRLEFTWFAESCVNQVRGELRCRFAVAGSRRDPRPKHWQADVAVAACAAGMTGCFSGIRWSRTTRAFVFFCLLGLFRDDQEPI